MWDVSEDLVSFFMGRPPAGNDERPVEPICDGCPGGDQRCLTMASLWPFYRRRDGNGGRVANPLLDRGDLSDLGVRALLYFEGEQDACASEQLRSEREQRDRESNGT